MREITIGQYYPVDSIIHRLDPRTKLFITFAYVVVLFLCDSWWSYIASVLALCIVIALCRVPLGYILRGLKAILILLMFSVVFNLFFTQGNEIFRLGFIKITDAGLTLAGRMAIRLICLVMGSSIMTLTTTPNSLTDGMERGLGFLKRIKVPVHEIAMMMSIALRFIPILVEETDKIMKAQMARGADFESGNLFAKAKALVPLLVPLFVSAFRRATDLATAMESRGYHGGEGRTKMKPLKYGIADYVAYVLTGIFIIIIAIL